jgi:hypothetical protein
VNPDIVSFAAGIASDISDFDSWSIEPVQSDLENHPHNELDNDPYETAISVATGERRILLIKFYRGEDFCEQAVEALNQIQDVVVETELKPWPKCQLHAHVLVPMCRAGQLSWVCPDESSMVVAVGQL